MSTAVESTTVEELKLSLGRLVEGVWLAELDARYTMKVGPGGLSSQLLYVSS